MSSFDFNENSVTAPEHHIHESSEPLPGQRGAAPTTDYSVSAMERAPSSAADPSNVDNKNTSTDFARSASTGSQTASNTERPMGVQPVSEGGVAVGGNEGELPMGHAKFGDKVIGKTQKVIGKYTNNSEMHEKGELREAGGKAAALGEARAPHD